MRCSQNKQQVFVKSNPIPLSRQTVYYDKPTPSRITKKTSRERPRKQEDCLPQQQQKRRAALAEAPLPLPERPGHPPRPGSTPVQQADGETAPRSPGDEAGPPQTSRTVFQPLSNRRSPPRLHGAQTPLPGGATASPPPHPARRARPPGQPSSSARHPRPKVSPPRRRPASPPRRCPGSPPPPPRR